MILKVALEKAIGILKTADIDTPATEAGVILCYALRKDKTFLYTHSDYELNEEKVNRFFSMINLRAKGMPTQYITGNQEFMSIDFIVNPNVLIPRHETEILVETILDYCTQLKVKTDNENIEILDIGTGSGCIAISLAKYIQNCRVTAVDISKKALETARLNAINAGVQFKVLFLKSNLFEVFRTSAMKKTTFDIIVSNPPYIDSDEMKTLQREVKDFEPASALFGGEDGLDFYRAIISDAGEYLKQHGLLSFEVGYRQANDVAQLMENSYYDIKTVKDLSKIDRVVLGQLR